MTEHDHAADRAAIRPKGRPIVLDDGTEILVRVDLDNLWLIEERFGSIDALLREVNALSATDATARPLFQPLIRALAALMPWQHEELRDPAVLRRALDPAKFGDYVTTAVLSLTDAIATGPAPADGPGNAPAPDQEALAAEAEQVWTPERTATLPPFPASAYPPDAAPLPPPWIQDSRGDSSTTPGPSYSDGPMTSSGG